MKALESGALRKKKEKLRRLLSPCRLCPRECGAGRLKGERGFCGAGSAARVSSYFPHFGEERCLVGDKGSGTIFFSYCNLKCVFCQNYEISHLAEGRNVSDEELAAFMLELQERGCGNINLVTPTHFVWNILGALESAAGRGLKIPLVYNCGGYESAEVLKILDGVVDIYMPDAKFAGEEKAVKYCGAPDYFENLKKALKIMREQTGDLKIENGLARRGLLVRHLVMPSSFGDSAAALRFLAGMSRNTFVNIMAQYYPCGRAFEHPEINRGITAGEYGEVIAEAKRLGLRGFS